MPRRKCERLLRRQATLAAVRGVFAERGYVHTTLDEVAARAKFGKGTLYNFFLDGKEELLRAVLADLFDELAALMEFLLQTPVSDTKAFRTALHAYLAHNAHFFYRNRDLFYLLMREAWRLQLSVVEKSRNYFHVQINRSVTTLSGFIKDAVAAGAIWPLPARR